MRAVQEMIDDLQTLIRTRHVLVRIETLDETDAAEIIRRAAVRLKLPVYWWSVVDGLTRQDDSARRGEVVPDTQSVITALGYLRQTELRAAYVFKGALKQVAGRAVETRMMQEAAEAARKCASTIFLVDAAGELPVELSAMAVPYELSMPTVEELRGILVKTLQDLRVLQDITVDLTEAELNHFLQCLRGLTRVEARQLVSQCLLDDLRLTKDDFENAVARKRQRIGESGTLDFIATDDTPQVGGMESLRKWLGLRKNAMSAEARAFGLDAPRGILMLGVQGCGKSLMARSVAAEWKLPLLRLDVGALYDKYIGESERQLRRAFKLTASLAPCVLWIDEIEKAFASAASQSADGGLSQRMFGSLLSWLQDHKDPVFVVATANDISALPPELMRKGRFDEMFFVDLPGEKARAQIAAVHLLRRKRNYKKYDVRAIAASCEGFSGAEIEQAIVASMYAAFAARRDVTTQDVLDEIARTRPLSVTMAERVAELRAWAHGRCVMAD